MTDRTAPNEAQRDEARRRFAALTGAGTAAERRALQDWLQADPAHLAAWAEVEALWHEAVAPGQRLAAREAGELAVYLDAMDRRAGRKRGLRNAALGLGLLLMVLVSGGVWLRQPGLWQDLAADHVTARGERREIALADGSRVLLDAGSALSVDIGPGERRLTLLRGAASFRVTPSPVPFRVRFGAGYVTVHGTVFDIRLLPDGGMIVLQEGSVAVTHPGLAAPQMMTPESQLTLSGGTARIEAVDPADARAWHEGRFVFEQMRLGDLVATLERYGEGRIVLTSAALADRRLSGSLNLNDPGAALRSLGDGLGLRVTRLPGPLTLLRP